MTLREEGSPIDQNSLGISDNLDIEMRFGHESKCINKKTMSEVQNCQA